MMMGMSTKIPPYGKIEAEIMPYKRGCVKIGMPSYLLKNAQRPNFPKLGLCHVVKISYLYDTKNKLCKSTIFARILQIKRFFFQKESTRTYPLTPPSAC